MSEQNLNPRISLRDIAKKLGLSHSTVSLALRNHPRISQTVRKKIHETAKEMGYRPDPMLAALAHYRHGKLEPQMQSVIGWLNFWPKPEMLRSFHEFDLYWQGAAACAEKFGYRLEEFVCNTEFPLERVAKVFHTRNITGILIPPQPKTPDWGNFPWNNFSAVRFGRSCKTPKTHLVTSNQVENTILAFRKIRERGYERVGFVTGTTAAERGALFRAGFLMAQSEVPDHLRLPVMEIVEQSASRAQHLRQLTAWMKKTRPDVVMSDLAPVRELLEHAGYGVPQQVGLVAESVLDGNADAGIYQNPEEIGRVALLMVISLINDNARGIPAIFRQTIVAGEWRDGLTLPWRKATKPAAISMNEKSWATRVASV